MKECRIPLLWNANGSIEVIQQDDISAEEAEKILKILEGEYCDDKPLPKSCAPSPSPSIDLSNDRDYHERMLSLDETSKNHHHHHTSPLCLDEINYHINKTNLVPAAIKSRTFNQHHHYSHLKQHESRRLPQHHTQQQRVQQSSTDRVYSCPICAKKFSRKFNLNTHIKCVHSDDKDYVCPFCQRAFNHSSNLRKHIKTVHGEEKRLPCPECKKPFKHNEALKSHLRVIHGKNSF